MNYNNTRVSILSYRSDCGLIIYYRMINISGMNLTISEWQFLTIVSNLNLSFDAFVQFIYYLFFIIFYNIGLISFECNYDTDWYPHFIDNFYIKIIDFCLFNYEMFFDDWMFSTMLNNVWIVEDRSNFYILFISVYVM